MRRSLVPSLVMLSGAACLLAACAGMIAPPGGPEDRIPPMIVVTEPDTNAVNVLTEEILLEFSEYVDRRSVEDAVFISPYTGGVEFDWSGTALTITPKEPFRRNRTYVVTVGTDVVDRRGKNRMASGFTLAFSTGDSLDRGSVTGRVVDEKPDGVLVFAYALEGLDPDTLNPAAQRPDYIMQAGKEGTFTLSNMATGAYRLYAVRDQFRDFLYQAETDQFGVLPRDLRLLPDAPAAGPVLFRLSREDTTRPFLTAARALAPRTVEVRFSERIDSLSALRAVFAVLDTGRTPVTGGVAFALDRKSGTSGILITSAPLSEGTAYRLTADSIRDEAGNLVDTVTAELVGSTVPDTLAPAVTIGGVRDSVRGHRPDRPLVLEFSEPVLKERAAAGVQILDSLGSAATFAVSWLSDAACVLTPSGPLAERSRYRVLLEGKSVEDYYGNRRGDSLLVFPVRTLDPRTTGYVEGRVTDVRDTARGEVVVVARTLVKTGAAEHTLVLADAGPFRFDRLPEGAYAVWAFRDADSSGAFTPGHPFPWKPSERFAVFADTVKVRARWNVEGVNLILR